MIRARLLAVLFLLLAPAACVHGQPAAPEAGPFLWRAEKDGRVSYLFGTVHAGVDAQKELPPVVWSTLAERPCFVMEADQDQVDAQALIALGTLPAGESLQRQVSPETWRKLVARVGPTVGTGGLDRAQPWFAGLLYLQTVLPAGEPMDASLKARAAAGGKRIGYLEGWREAIDAFAKATGPKDLEEAVRNEGEAERDVAKLVAAYRSGDERALAKAMEELQSAMSDGGAAQVKLLLDDRNTAWLPRLEREITKDKDGCFVAVGAGHLVGEGNLRDMLRKRGYRIERVRAAAP